MSSDHQFCSWSPAGFGEHIKGTPQLMAPQHGESLQPSCTSMSHWQRWKSLRDVSAQQDMFLLCNWNLSKSWWDWWDWRPFVCWQSSSVPGQWKGQGGEGWRSAKIFTAGGKSCFSSWEKQWQPFPGGYRSLLAETLPSVLVEMEIWEGCRKFSIKSDLFFPLI